MANYQGRSNQEVAARKQARDLTKTANDLAEQVRCLWDSLTEERLLEIVKEIKVIDKEIKELEKQY